MGQKEKNTHAYRRCVNTEIDKIKEEFETKQANISLAQVIDDSILRIINIWPTNYIAYDI
jgi:hypothetical protein